MNFEEIYGDSAVIAKLLEFRWFYGTSAKPHLERNVAPHRRRPFLARNLSYIRASRRENNNRRKQSARQFPTKRKSLDFFLANSSKACKKAKKLPATPTTSVLELERGAFERFCQASSKLVREKSHSSPSSLRGQGMLKKMWRDLDAASRQYWLDDAEPAASKETNALSEKSPVTTMFFHFVYGSKDGYPIFQTERRNDRNCPFCFHNAVTDGGIVSHCNASHGEFHAFDAARSEDGNLHVCVKLNSETILRYQGSPEKSKDFVFCRSRQDEVVLDVPIVNRTKRKAASLGPAERKRLIGLLKRQNAPQSLIDNYKPCDNVPLRQYYHPQSGLPMVGQEWNVDDDKYIDETWREELGNKLLDEFEDVSDDEKRFLKLWNNFIRSCTLISDASIPSRCMHFVQKYANEMHQLGLRNELLLHLTNFWDYGLISPGHVETCLKLFDTRE